MHQPIINALASFLALGAAVNGRALQRAGGILEELIADGAVDPATIGILESIIAAVRDLPSSNRSVVSIDATDKRLGIRV